VATSLPVTLYFISTGSPTLLSLGNCHITTLLRVGPILSALSSLKYFTDIITANTIIPLTTMIIIITIRSAHIGFEDAKYKVTGKDVATMLDTFFFYTSYLIMVIVVLGYFVYVAM
jgi:hypothetical protein